MFGKLRDAINSVLRIQKSGGTHFFTEQGKQKLVEAKSFLRQHLRLITGLFISVIVVSLAFLRLLESFFRDIIIGMFGRAEGLYFNVGDSRISYGAVLAYLLSFIVTFILALVFVRKLAGGVNIPDEERTRRCPMCGEQILEIATKCKHCGSTVGRERTHTYGAHPKNSPAFEQPRRERRPDYNRPRNTQGAVRGDAEAPGKTPVRKETPQDKRGPYPTRRKTGRFHSRYETRGERRDDR